MKVQTMRRLRQLHLYCGMFFAPAILFFAFSGMLQVIGLQDQRNPPPPGWIAWMANIHKHQASAPRRHAEGPRPAAARAQPTQPKGPAPAEPPFVPLKIFALLLALGLMASTVLGMVIALDNRAMRRGAGIALALGVVVPLVLMVV